jgi:hypothetical protein
MQAAEGAAAHLVGDQLKGFNSRQRI